MDKRVVQQHLIALLRSELTGTELDSFTQNALTPDTVSALLALAKRHDLAHIMAAAVRKWGGRYSPELTEALQQEEFVAVYRQEKMTYTLNEVSRLLEDDHVPYILLKGAVLKEAYPHGCLRTCCDLDILVKPEDVDAVTRLLTDKGYAKRKNNFHDISFFSPSHVHVELHFSLLEAADNIDAVLTHAWEQALPDGSGGYRFTDEFFIFHLYAHLLHHFQRGGCGLRPLIDIWVVRHRMGLDYTIARDLLEKAGIYTFAGTFNQLADKCLGGDPLDELEEILLSYILEGHMYGSTNRQIAVQKSKTPSLFSYVCKRTFLPYRDMCENYSVLKKCPFLLPFCWVMRFFKALFGKRALNELKMANQVSNSQLEQIRGLYARLGL